MSFTKKNTHTLLRLIERTFSACVLPPYQLRVNPNTNTLRERGLWDGDECRVIAATTGVAAMDYIYTWYCTWLKRNANKAQTTAYYMQCAGLDYYDWDDDVGWCVCGLWAAILRQPAQFGRVWRRNKTPHHNHYKIVCGVKIMYCTQKYTYWLKLIILILRTTIAAHYVFINAQSFELKPHLIARSQVVCIYSKIVLHKAQCTIRLQQVHTLFTKGK